MGREGPGNFSEEDLTNLYYQESQNLFRFLYSFTGDTHLAEDLLQEVFISLLKKQNEGDLPGDARSFLYTAAYFAHKNHQKSYRSRAFREKKYSDRQPVFSETAFTEKKSGLSLHIARMLHESGNRLLQPQQQMLLRYTLFSPLNSREIMKITGLSKTSYYRELNSCYRIIRDALLKEGFSAEDFQ